MKDDDELLTPRETAKILRLKTEETLSVWRCNKRYPDLTWVKVGRLVRYRKSAVEEFLQRHTH